MTSKNIRKQIILIFVYLITLCIVLVLSLIFANIFTIYTRNSSNSSKSQNPIESVFHPPIHINNNWSDAKTALICTGSGTYGDPYVIEYYDIEGQRVETGIFIENTSEYFKIENCSFFSLEIGIRLNNVSTGIISNNNFSSNDRGINLYANAFNISIIGNNFIKNYEGIRFYISSNSDNNTIINNFFLYQDYCAVEIDDTSDNNTIYKNYFYYNYPYQVRDHGLNNRWYNRSIGNYWSDYYETDSF
ncbi:MAG: NosD domain-containing protein [Candidatus Thorarchaeota archaeon]